MGLLPEIRVETESMKLRGSVGSIRSPSPARRDVKNLWDARRRDRRGASKRFEGR